VSRRAWLRLDIGVTDVFIHAIAVLCFCRSLRLSDVADDIVVRQ
jgi:hypothetical protein